VTASANLTPEGKLKVTDVLYGEILDVAVDTTTGMVALTEQLLRLARRAENERPAVVVVRLTGTGAWPGPVGVHEVNKWERAVRQFERMDVPTVAVASGECGPAVTELLLAADLRWGDPGTSLRIGNDSGGAWPGMGMYRLAQRLGPGAARRVLLFDLGTAGLRAAEAVRLGLLDEVTGDPDARLAGLHRDAPRRRDTSMRRSLLLGAAQTPFEVALGTHLAACDRTLRAAPRDVP
jgi:isomerase DpgB